MRDYPSEEEKNAFLEGEDQSDQDWMEAIQSKDWSGEISLAEGNEIASEARAEIIGSIHDNLESLRDRAEKSEAELVQLRSQIGCIYCGQKFQGDAQKEECVNHITTCEKSPLVQQVKEMEARCTDYVDLMLDEFQRIRNLTDNSEIHGICDRASEVMLQREHVIDQRDRAEAKSKVLGSKILIAEAEVKRLREALLEVYAWAMTDSSLEAGSFTTFAEEIVPKVAEVLGKDKVPFK